MHVVHWREELDRSSPPRYLDTRVVKHGGNEVDASENITSDTIEAKHTHTHTHTHTHNIHDLKLLTHFKLGQTSATRSNRSLTYCLRPWSWTRWPSASSSSRCARLCQWCSSMCVCVWCCGLCKGFVNCVFGGSNFNCSSLAPECLGEQNAPVQVRYHHSMNFSRTLCVSNESLFAYIFSSSSAHTSDFTCMPALVRSLSKHGVAQWLPPTYDPALEVTE